MKRRALLVAKVFGAAIALVALLLAGALAWPKAAAPLPDGARDYVIANVHVVDVERGRAGPLVSVTVREGRIAAIGPRPAVPALPIVDGGGGWLLPGFWDMHVHSFQLSPQLHLPLFVANGVTGVRDMMDCPGERDSLIACVADKRRWSAAAAAGRMASPRFVSVASYYLESPGLGPDAVSQRARAARGRGLDELKVYNRLSRPAYARAAAEARRLGLRLVGHLPKAVPLDAAIAAGQRSFEHAHLFLRHCWRRAGDWREGRLDKAAPARLAEAMVAEHDPEACGRAFAAMAARGARFVPTHVTREEDMRAGDPAFAADPRLDWLDPLSRWAFRDDLAGTRKAHGGAAGERALGRYFAAGLKLTGAAHRAGVRVLVGTDTAIGGFRYHDEMAWLVRAGLTPAEVLRAATIEAARYAGQDGRFGSVAVGKEADLVLLDADPLKVIAATRRIRAVAVAGRLNDRARLDSLLAFTRRQAGRPFTMVKLLWGFLRSSVSSDL